MTTSLRCPSIAAGLIFVLGTPALHAATVVGTLRVDPNRRAGMDDNGNVLIYAPPEVEGGSSISHWDRFASPNLLMEPSASNSVQGVDLTPALFRDIGWLTAGGANVAVDFADPPGQGFNATSLGAARRNAFQAAADVWGGILSSAVTINIRASFTSLECDEEGAVLAQASPQFVFTLGNAPLRNTWYAGPLAEALAGANLSAQDDPDPTAADLRVTFNSEIDEECLGSGSGFHYGTSGGTPGGLINFVSVALHEIAHGLGFISFTDAGSGDYFMGRPDAFSHFLFDRSMNRHWSEMTSAQIRTSATNSPHLAWDGANVRAEAPALLDPGPTLVLSAPSNLAGSYPVGTANFGPSLQAATVTGELAIVDDGSASPTLGCAPAQNRSELAGRIAIVDRGTCLFVDKARRAQAAGAVALLVVNNEPGLIDLGGNDPTIVIPAVMVSQLDGDAIKAELTGEPEPPDDREDPSVCSETETNLCLTANRFRVEVEFVDAEGPGIGQAEKLTSDTGYFWFFSRDNVELVVKVLDACNGFDRFWIFAGGLTNVEVDLKVVDTQTGFIRRYHNPPATPFAPIQDTDAFATCP